jgi:hypothetical protein
LRPLKTYHLVWLGSHPNRTEAWLRARLYDGFDIHHLDGNHDNNEPANLALVEHTDHMALHGGRTMGRMTSPRKKRAPTDRKLSRKQVDKILTDWRLTRAYSS